MGPEAAYWAMKHLISVCIGLSACRLARMRRPVLYWALFLLVAFIPDLGLMSEVAASAVSTIGAFAVLPMAFCDSERVSSRLLVALFTLLVAAMGETAGSAFYVLAFGKTIGDMAAIAQDTLPVLTAQAVDVAVMAALTSLLSPITRDFLENGVPSSIRRAIWVMPAGIVPVCLLLTLGISCFPADAALLAPIPVLAAACLASSLLALRAISAAKAEAEQAARAEALESALQGCLDAYGELERDAERSAKLRHDARNHLGVLSALIAEGETSDALAYARALADEYRAGEQ